MVCARSAALMPVVTPWRASMLTVNAVPSGGPGAAGRLHHRQLEPLDLLLGEREADEAPAVGRHEVDGVGRDELGGHRQVALVLAILVVDEDDHLAGADVGDGAGDALGELWGRWCESTGSHGCVRFRPRLTVLVPASAKRAT